jgi:hypothetical protein
LIAWTSPRTKEFFHEPCNFACLAHIGRIASERGRFGREPGSAPLALCRFRDRLSSCFCAGYVSATGEVVERSQPVRAEPKRERRGR